MPSPEQAVLPLGHFSKVMWRGDYTERAGVFAKHQGARLHSDGRLSLSGDTPMTIYSFSAFRAFFV